MKLIKRIKIDLGTNYVGKRLVKVTENLKEGKQQLFKDTTKGKKNLWEIEK